MKMPSAVFFAIVGILWSVATRGDDVRPRYVGNLLDVFAREANTVIPKTLSLTDAMANSALLTFHVAWRLEAAIQGKIKEEDLKVSDSHPPLENVIRQFLWVVSKQYIGCGDAVYTKVSDKIYRGTKLYVTASVEVLAPQSATQGQRLRFSFQPTLSDQTEWEILPEWKLENMRRESESQKPPPPQRRENVPPKDPSLVTVQDIKNLVQLPSLEQYAKWKSEQNQQKRANKQRWVPSAEQLPKMYADYEWLSGDVAKGIGRQQIKPGVMWPGVTVNDIIACSDVPRYSNWDKYEKDIERLDSSLAVEYITKLASGGDVDALAMVGISNGDWDFLHKAANGGSLEAARWLGNAFLNGVSSKDIAQDYDMAFSYFQKAAKAGDLDAAIMPNTPVAFLERLKQKGGNAKVSVVLGRCYLFGRGAQASAEKAAAAYRDARSQIEGQQDALSNKELAVIKQEADVFLAIDLSKYPNQRNLDPVREAFLSRLPFDISLPFKDYAK